MRISLADERGRDADHLWGGEGAVLSTCMLGDGDGEALELIGAYLEILERQSESIRIHPSPSHIIRGNQRQSAHLELLKQIVEVNIVDIVSTFQVLACCRLVC